jgi:Domain of unknown function (DUF4142)
VKLRSGTTWEHLAQLSAEEIKQRGMLPEGLKPPLHAIKSGVVVPADIDAEHKAARARLDGLPGPAFDVVCLQSQVMQHQKAAQLLQSEISNGQNGQLQRLAAESLPDVLDHPAISTTNPCWTAGNRATGVGHCGYEWTKVKTSRCFGKRHDVTAVSAHAVRSAPMQFMQSA